jgi:hypothetical protein
MSSERDESGYDVWKQATQDRLVERLERQAQDRVSERL